MQKKSFVVPGYLDRVKTVEATDMNDNKTTFTFKSNSGHITLGGEEIERVYATCTTEGSHKIQYKCRVCGKVVRTETVSDKALGHNFGSWTATGVANKEERKCTRCEYTETRDATVKMTDTKVYLSSTNYVYDGNRKEPTVTVKAGNKTLVNGKDYTVNYDNNVKAGTATVTVTKEQQQQTLKLKRKIIQ